MIAAATQTGCHIYCEKAMLELRKPGDAYIYPAPRVLPDHTKLSWEKLHLADGHDRPENTPDFLRKNWLDLGNLALARDLIDAIDHDREPLSSLGHALFFLLVFRFRRPVLVLRIRGVDLHGSKLSGARARPHRTRTAPREGAPTQSGGTEYVSPFSTACSAAQNTSSRIRASIYT